MTNPRVRRLLGGAAIVGIAGVVVLVAGWAGIHDQDIFAAQVPWLVSGGFMGVSLLGLAAVLASVAVRRGRTADELAELDEAVTLVRHLQSELPALRARARKAHR